MTNILDCKRIANHIFQSIEGTVTNLKKPPFLVGIRLEGDPSAETYANGIKRDCQRCGIHYEEYIMPNIEDTGAWNKRIQMLNDDAAVDAIMVFRPAPDNLYAIAPGKDVDAYDVGAAFGQCTPEAVMRVLHESNIPVAGKHVVVVGRSAYVGRPLMMLLLNANATLTVCHSETNDLSKYTSLADILISATGRPGLIRGNMIKPGATVIDVGVSKKDGHIRGDVDATEARVTAANLATVPGGVGLVTRSILMEHILKAAGENQHEV